MNDSVRDREWSRLTAVIDRLLDAPPPERAALIEELSAGDAGRRAELHNLLAECEREPLLLTAPAAERFEALFHAEPRFPDALVERYEVVRELGRGGMATVYLARDVKHNREVAVKIVHPALAASLGADRFLHEIELVAQLHHPHIIPLFDSGKADGALYYVMPYTSGLSLRRRLARDGALEVEEVVRILRDVSDALTYAHSRGIVHRDIKPDNVLLADRHAMVADFGIAKAASNAAEGASATSGDAAFGTPPYMAPEQIARGADSDHRADLYSVGVMGYELLTGKPPFTGASRQEILSAHLNETPIPLTTIRGDIPQALSDILMRCLEKNPANRWQSADDVREALESLWAGRDVVVATAPSRERWRRTAALSLTLVIAGILTALAWRASREDGSWRGRWTKMHIEKVTDFPGSEVDAALSTDGRFVAFLSDRDSVFDAFVTRLGSGRFVNLTGGRYGQLFNEDVRNVGFTPDARNLWVRVADLTSPASVTLVPVAGGRAQPFLSTAVMAAWSPDGSRLAYHETTPGDPIFVAAADGRDPRQIYVATAGQHSHHLTWSRDGRFIYFSHGLPPDEMDIWRVPAGGGNPERITSHNSRVGYPVLVDDRTLLYTGTAADGTGPWLYMMDLKDRIATRLSTGVEHFISIAAASEVPGQPRRLVATVSNPSVELWTAPLTGGISAEAAVAPLSLPTARSAAPRFGRDSSLLYLASRSGADALWRLSGATATELWRPTDGAIVGAAATSPDGTRLCLPVRHAQRSSLWCMSNDGAGARAVGESLDVRGAPSWSPDGKWIAVAAKDGKVVRTFRVPFDGGPAIRLVDSVSSNPVWSPDGRFILYSGTPRGRSVPLKAVTPDGKPFPLPFAPLVVDRLGDSYRFLPDGSGIVVKLGGFRRQDFWLLDVATGNRRQLTRLRPGESVHRFDVSPDGRRIVFERVRENSDIALIEVPDGR